MSRRAAPAWLHIGIIAFVLIAGAALRISQFVANPSLWFDEIAVARNVFDRPLGALLFEPLDYGQTAPPGFLLAEKAATLLLGRTDWGLRLFPFLASLASLFVFAHLARRLLSAAGALVSITLFAFAFPLIYFVTQTKQVLVRRSRVRGLDGLRLPPSNRHIGIAAAPLGVAWCRAPVVFAGRDSRSDRDVRRISRDASVRRTVEFVSQAGRPCRCGVGRLVTRCHVVRGVDDDTRDADLPAAILGNRLLAGDICRRDGNVVAVGIKFVRLSEPEALAGAESQSWHIRCQPCISVLRVVASTRFGDAIEPSHG